MRASCAALAVTAILGVPTVASAAELAVNQDCFARGTTVTITGSGYTPNSTATLVLGTTTGTTPVDDQGGFTTTLTAPKTSLRHPGAQQLSLTATDDVGVAATTPVNVMRPGVDGVPSTSTPHQRITWNIAGFPGTKALYGHWRIHGKTRADHRMGVPQGPCGVLHVRARQIEAKRALYGIWFVQFDFNRHYDKHALPRTSIEVAVTRGLS